MSDFEFLPPVPPPLTFEAMQRGLYRQQAEVAAAVAQVVFGPNTDVNRRRISSDLGKRLLRMIDAELARRGEKL